MLDVIIMNTLLLVAEVYLYCYTLYNNELYTDENLVFCPERTLTQVISHIHYFPEDWKGNAHTYKVAH